MPDTMHASTPDDWHQRAQHPVLSDPPVPMDRVRPKSTNADVETAKAVFRERISGPVVQAKCIRCHVRGGISEHTRLRFVGDSAIGHVTANYQQFGDFLDVEPDGAEIVLDKIAGRRGHGGGPQVPADSASHGHMRHFLSLLAAEGAGRGGDLFAGVSLKSSRKVLYQAAIMFAGRPPTRAEYASVSHGGDDQLRIAVRSLMSGRGFYDFVVRGANDRLLVHDRLILSSWFLVPHRNRAERLFLKNRKHGEWRPAAEYMMGVNYGVWMGPLELVAHVALNDLPYTEILTADYVMANPQTALAYGDKTVEFDDPTDVHEFRPTRIVDYYVGWGERTCDEDHLCTVDPLGTRIERHPHAGLLSARSALYRHPTTPTNRNRARARWALLHYLGVDAERLGNRTIDPAALLADEPHPTRNNPACNACHRVIDPVAGLFLRYEYDGEMRPNYRYSYWLYGQMEKAAWNAAMGAPGIDGRKAPDTPNDWLDGDVSEIDHLGWLAKEIVNDNRFAPAAVRFWWPAVMGTEVAQPAGDGQRIAALHQSATVSRLADGFRQGFGDDGKPYNLKDLLVEIVMTKWFRAQSVSTTDPVRLAALADAGAVRPLTPEELVAKTDALTGVAWSRIRKVVGPERDRPKSRLTRNYMGYYEMYGGSNARTASPRHRRFTLPMAQVAKRHAVKIATLAVLREFFFAPTSDRRLFTGIGLDETPGTDEGAAGIKAKIVELHDLFYGEHSAADVERSYSLLASVWSNDDGVGGGWPGWSSHPPHSAYPTPGGLWDYWNGSEDHRYFDGILDDADVLSEDHAKASYSELRWNRAALDAFMAGIKPDQEELRMAEAWSALVATMMMHYRYLHL